MNIVKELRKARGIQQKELAISIGVSRPTVSVMLRELRAGGFVIAADNGALSLTEAGVALANKIYERHCLICDALMALGVSRETALEDACKMEHDISEETAGKLRDFVQGSGV